MSDTGLRTEEEGARAPEPRVVGARYELGREIGAGGASVVHAATDLVSGETVAVKILRAGASSDGLRVSREVAALQHLRLPGVVTLRDVGVDDGRRFLVMDLVEGEPFPGAATPIAWSALAPITIALLETLGRVHAAGIVHRDLKPSNVLVAPSGHVTILDFGISWGPALGEAVTAPGAVLGTLEYLAPEQFKGHRGDPRSDLYAVGTMLYEALCGRPPHRASELGHLIWRKLSEAPAPLRASAPDTPRVVVRIIESLLSADPSDRPATAGAVLADLRGGEVTACAGSPLPWLGDRRVLDALAAAAREGRPADVHGLPGSGRSRALTTVADELESEGRSVLWLPDGSAPYESLERVVGPMNELRAVDHADAAQQVQARLRDRLTAGDVIAVDDLARIDRWSADALESVRDAGAVLRVVDEPRDGALALGQLDEEALQPLFAGPEVIFHLRSDAARELWRRTGGHQWRVAAEVAAWVRAGLANWEGELLDVSTEALHHLRGGLPVSSELFVRPATRTPHSPEQSTLLCWLALAWPSSTPELVAQVAAMPRWQIEPLIDALEQQGLARRLGDGRVEPVVAPQALVGWTHDDLARAHHALADALEPGDPSRFGHVVASGDPAAIVDEALVRARSLDLSGFAGDALAVLEQGLSASRLLGDAESEERLLLLMAEVALGDGSHAAFQRVLYEIGRAKRRTELLAHTDRLLQAAREGDTGDAEATLAALEAIPPFDAWELELWRQGQRFRCAQRAPDELRSAVFDDVARWVAEIDRPAAHASLAAWRAIYTWKSGDPSTAGRLSLEAVDGKRSVSGLLANLTNAAMAFLEAGEIENCAAAARRARDEASRCRAPLFEAHAEALLRSVAYRRGDAQPADEEFLGAVRLVGDPLLESAVLLTEASVHWRAGATGRARELAAAAADACRRAGAVEWDVVARALGAVCGDVPDALTLRRMARDAETAVESEAAVQALGLLALADAEHAPRLRRIAAARAEALVTRDERARRDVLSLRECLVGLET